MEFKVLEHGNRYLRDLDFQVMPRLGPEAYTSYLHMATCWIPRTIQGLRFWRIAGMEKKIEGTV